MEEIPGVSKLPASQICPIACFCMAQKLRMVFAFLNGWKKIFGDTLKLCEIKISVS